MNVNKHIRFIALLTALTISACVCAGERYFFSNISVDKGLSQLTVTSIFQDSKGFMWFGTRNGLNRFDGYSFNSYMADPDNSNTISDYHILCINEDKDGYLWVGTNNGLNRIDLHNNKIKRYFSDSNRTGTISHDIINSICIDNHDRLWIGTNGGVDLYDPKTDTFSKITVSDSETPLTVNVIRYLDNKLYIGTSSEGLIVYDIPTGKHTAETHNPQDKGSIPDNYVREIFIDKQKNLWVGTRYNGVSVKRDGSNVFYTINTSNGLTNNYVRCINQSPKGDIIVGTFNGLNVIDHITGHVEQYSSYGSQEGDLSHYSIYSIYFDRAKTIWIGTYAGGVDYYNKYGQKFNFYDFRKNGTNILGIIGPMVESEENIYVSTEGSGLIEVDKRNYNFNNYLIFPNTDISYAQNIIKTLYRDGNTILCGTSAGTIYSFDMRSRRFSRAYNITVTDPIYYIGRNSRGDLMVGNVNDLCGLIFISKDGRMTNRFPVGGGTVNFSNVRCVLEVSDNRYLIGTRNDGLYDYDMNAKRLTQYKNTYKRESADTTRNQSIPENYISSIYRDKSNNIWIGTFGGGFSKFDIESGSFHTYSTKNNLSNNNVCSIVEDKSGHLWISTMLGISDFDPETQSFNNYTHANGVKIDEFTPHAGIALTSNKIAFAGNNGMVTFDPESMYLNPFVPPVVLRNIYVHNRKIIIGDETSILKENIDHQQKIVLKHNQSNFSIEYSALNYVFSERNQYSYILEGFDKQWNNVDTRRMAYYTNVPPGKYRFIVKASNNDEVWNEQGTEIEIIVRPPLWGTWYAYLVYTLLITAFVCFVVRYYTERKRLENDIKLRQAQAQVQEEFHAARNTLFSNFSHELRTPLMLIMSPLEDILENTHSLEKRVRENLTLMLDNAHRLLRLVNNLMDFQKKESGRMVIRAADADFVTFSNEIIQAFSELALSRDIHITLECNCDSIPYRFDQSLMEKVFFNYMSNAFKNTPGQGHITVRIKLCNLEELTQVAGKHADSFTNPSLSYILMEIEDSGSGIPDDELEKIFIPFYQVSQNEHSVSGTGLGLSLSKSIIEMHHGVIWAENAVGSGALFRTILPIDNTLFAEEQAIVFSDNDNLIIKPAPSISDAEISGSKHYKILVVEDNADVRRYIVSHLSHRYQVSEASNGVKGVDYAVKELPDLILTDIMMPQMDGTQLVATLKNDIRTSHIPIIMLTAKAMTSDIKEGYDTGADDYIVKPFNASVLLSRVENIIRTREKLKNIYGKQFSLESLGIEKTSVDERFMNKLYGILEKNISNPEFNLDNFSKDIGMSRANLYRKIKATTNLSPNEFIRNFRLEMGAKILRESQVSVSEVFVAVGFGSHAYFSNCFKSLYGISPSEYAAQIGGKKEL